MNVSTLIIIPTHNEAASIRNLCLEVLTTLAADILVVDDASTDQTRSELGWLSDNHPGRVHTLFRPEATGLGSAYLAGFRWALARHYTVIIQMDGDGSHPPRFLLPMQQALDEASLVVGSRYVPGARNEDTLVRQGFSRIGNFLAKRQLKGPIRDLTGGFNGWQCSLLARLLEQPFFSHGHAFQMELKSRALQEPIAIKEFPITFKPRIFGKSKLRFGHLGESLNLLGRLRREARAHAQS